MFAIVRKSIALGEVVYAGGCHWSAAKPFAKPLTFEFKRDAEAMARGLGDKASVACLDKTPLTW